METNTPPDGAYVNRMALVMSYQMMGIHPTALPWAFVYFKNRDIMELIGEDMLAEELPAKED